MKNIQLQVKALEVAMQVATDIQDKPYAYAVARIQEALLDSQPKVEVLTVVPKAVDGEPWRVRIGPISTVRKSLTVIHPENHHCHYDIPFETPHSILQEFVDWFQGNELPGAGSWKLVLVSTSAWYLRSGKKEIPLGAVYRGTMGYNTLMDLQAHLETTSRGDTE